MLSRGKPLLKYFPWELFSFQDFEVVFAKDVCQCFKNTATTLDTTLITAYIFFSWKKYLADLVTFLLSNLLMHTLWSVKDSKGLNLIVILVKISYCYRLYIEV